jgi:hypothetical protein
MLELLILITLVYLTTASNKTLMKILTVLVLYQLIIKGVYGDIVLFSDQVYYVGNAFGPYNNVADAMCRSISEETIIPPFSCLRIFALLSYNSSYEIRDFPTIYGFSPTVSVIGPTSIPIGTWSTMLTNPPTGVVLVNNLIGARVITPLTNWFSGSDGLGAVTANTCSSWTSTVTQGTVGITGTTSRNWIINTLAFPCSAARPFICACDTTAPTYSPTKQPTTAKPTGVPSHAPSANPTISPTHSPTIRIDKQQVMYRITKGTRARIYRTVGQNISYHVMGQEVNTPVNVTLQGTSLQPILWSNVYWLGYNQTTNTTTTHHTAVCNPIANRIPGTTPDTFNGFMLCPTIYTCRNNTLETIAGDRFQDFRACILNKTITLRQDIPTIGSGVVTVQAIDINANSVDAVPPVQDVLFGAIQCNDFLDRSINCQLAKFLPAYRPQCQSQPIKCFSYSQGRYFGAFWNANPLFRYDIPRANWTLQHYVGIASTMNYLLYAQDDVLIDAFTSNVWNDYYWFSGLSSLGIQQRELSTETLITFQNDIIQAQEYNYLAGSNLPPSSTITGIIPTTPAINDCLVQLIVTGDVGGICLNQDWDHISYLQWRYPSYNIFFAVNPGDIIYSLTIETSFNFTGLEVYNTAGELCGTLLLPTTSAPANYTVSCINTPSGVVPAGINASISIRYFGTQAIWDIPNTTLSNSVPWPRQDDFDVQTYPYTNVINLLAATMYLYEYIVTGEIAPESFNWPGRTNDISNLSPSRYFLNYTSNETLNVNTLFQDVKNTILGNNTYPYNEAIAAWALRNSYQEIPVRYDDPVHLQWLYDTWANSLAPRQCTEFSDCMTIQHGACIFLERTDIQYTSRKNPVYWLQGDDPPGYTLPTGANEGGCVIFNVFNKGFYDRQLAGARCVEGYGPIDNQNRDAILQYSELVNYVGTPVGSCKLPSGIDPISAPLVDFNLCAGHGIASYTQTTSTQDIVQYSNGAAWLMAACKSIILRSLGSEDGSGGDGGESEKYIFIQEQVIDVQIQQFTHQGSTILSIINEQIFLNGTACLKTQDIIQCSETQIYSIQCINTFLYSLADIEFSSSYFNIKKGLQDYSFGIVYFE